MSSSSRVSLWVRAEPFTHGGLQMSPHPRLLSLHNIKKLVNYAKAKGKLGYPKLNYSIWKHIACNKLQLSESLAWVLFQTCIIMSASNNAKLKNLESKMFSCQTPEEEEQVKNNQVIELYRFILFLYIQQINKISLRCSAVSPNAEWPDTRKSADMEVCKSNNKNMDELQHLQFVLHNLTDILDILAEPESSSPSKNDPQLGINAFEAINLIIEGRMDDTGNVKSFSEMVQMSSIFPKLGYSKSSRTYSLKNTLAWIRSVLGSNPFSIEACLTGGKRLLWPLNKSQGDDIPNIKCQQKKQKIATTANLIPKEFGKGNKLILISSVNDQTIARSSGTLEQSTLKIHRCHYSYLYFLSPLRNVSVDKCRKTTVVLGAVENTVQLFNCEDCVIIVPTRRLVIIGCRRCTIYTSVSTCPLLSQGLQTSNTMLRSSSDSLLSSSNSTVQYFNEDICFAPYCSYYPNLEEHLSRSCLDPKVNFWDKPLVLGGPVGDKCWELLPPSDFYPITIPFDMEGSTVSCPVLWPKEYKDALKERSQRYEDLRAFISNSKLTPEQSRYFRNLVEKRFRSWLTESDEYRQLILLDPTTGGPTHFSTRSDSIKSTEETSKATSKEDI